MTKKEAIQLFQERKVRTVWDDEQEKWYFSIVDVCGVLTDSKDPTAYWRKLKQRLKEEGNETVTNCHALKPTDGVSSSHARNFFSSNPVRLKKFYDMTKKYY